MAKLFAVVQMIGGQPLIDAPYAGYVLVDQLGGFGAYIISGTAPQLVAVNALSTVTGIVAVTETSSKWPELDGIVSAGIRTKINAFLTARGLTNIPAGVTYRQAILTLYQKFNSRFDLSADITE